MKMYVLQMTLRGFKPCLRPCLTVLDHVNILEPWSLFLTVNEHNSPLGLPNCLQESLPSQGHKSIYRRYFPEPQFNKDQALDKVSVYWEQKGSTPGKCLVPYAQWFCCINKINKYFHFPLYSWSAKQRYFKILALL